MSYTWSAAALIAGHTALLARIDTGGAGEFRLRDDEGTLLATLALATPGGSVDAAGKLTLTPGAPESNAPASGQVATAELVAGDDAVILTYHEVAEGTAAVAGKLVLSTRSVIAGAVVELISAEIG